jgi:hypothetical protein
MALSKADFKLDEGFMNDFDGAITDAYFDKHPDPKYRAKTDELMLILTLDGPTLEEPEIKTYSIGAKRKWKSNDKGNTVVSDVVVDSHSFVKTARAGALVQEMAKCIGNGDIEKGMEFFATRGYYMTDANFYKNLNFHWLNKTLDQAGLKEDGTKATSEVLLPVAFLGEVKAGASHTAAPKQSAVPAQSIKPETKDNMDDYLIANVAGKTEREVKSWAMKDPTMKGNPTFQREVVSGTKLTDLVTAGTLVMDPDKKFI